MKQVSIIIPNYNHAAFLRKRIETVFAQTYNHVEIIILDDTSTDDSMKIILEETSRNPKVKIQSNIINSGSTFRQWNKGVANASGDYIWMAESDDVASPDFLAELIKPFDTDPDIVLAYCQSYRMNDKDEVTGTWEDHTGPLDSIQFKEDFIMDGKEYIERFLIHRNTIPNASAVLFRKDVYEKVGGAPEHLKTNGDWLTWLKMLCYGKVAFVAKPMNYFRYHGGSVIAKANLLKSSEEYLEQYDYTMRRVFKEFLKREQLQLSINASQTNDYFIALDKGNEGLFKLRKGKILQGWKQILGASVYPKLQSGFIKKGISGK